MTKALVVSAVLGIVAGMARAEGPAFLSWAPTPPMGWNSWDCFGTAVTEGQTKANADYMAEKLKSHGWEYVVVDIQWYEPGARGHDYRKGAELGMDQYGRLLPAANRFPSAASGAGFKGLAEYVHSKGLKFGIHLMRGIPRQAVARNTPVLGTAFHAADVANTKDTCPWNPDMYGVDMSKPGAQAYYDSVFALIASWEVDFVKVDDLSRPYFDHLKEVEGIRKAIDKSGRPMVLSTSPGETPIEAAEHVASHANAWRISDDFWDDWRALRAQFARCAKWAKYSGNGHWPDADMLPLGAVRVGQKNPWTRFTHDEQYALMSLWMIARSPLMLGGDLPRNDEFTLKLITNDEVLGANRRGANPREAWSRDGLVAWVSDVPGSRDKYVALFNTRDGARTATGPASGPAPREDGGGDGANVYVRDEEIGVTGAFAVRDLWARRERGLFAKGFSVTLPPHGAGLYLIWFDTPGRADLP